MKFPARSVASCLLASMAICGSNMKAQSAPDLKKSSSQFVQSFYSWYNRRAAGADAFLDEALKLKANAFSAELLKELKADSAAQAKVSGEIVGLDFDPILSTNAEPHKGYVVGKVVPKGKTFWVEVYGVDGNKRTPQPVASPEVAYAKGRWQFVNFHYAVSKFPENENLLSILKVLRRDREKETK